MAQPRARSARGRDRVLESRLYLMKKTQTEIANEIGVAQSTISKDFKVIERWWQRLAARNINKVKAEILAQLFLVVREAWEAWEKSKGDKETKSKVGSIINEEIVRPGALTVKLENSNGDPRYLQVILAAIKEIKAIYGLDLPQKFALTDPTGTKEAGSNTSEEIERMEAEQCAFWADQNLKREEQLN
jgi:hypothetical protein